MSLERKKEKENSLKLNFWQAFAFSAQENFYKPLKPSEKLEIIF